MGILSDIAKGLKNTIRGVGRIIKKTTKPLRKAIRAVLKPLKPIGKIFDKLGFIGTIALSFILPGIGTAIGTWLSSWGAGMAKFVSAVSRAISWVTKPIKFVRDSITGVLKQGMNRLGQAFGFDAPGKMAWKAGGEKIFDAAGNVTGTTTGHFAAGEAISGGLTLTDSLTNMAKKIFQRTETTTPSITGEPLGLEGLPGQQVLPPKQSVWSAEELEFKAPEFDPLTSADVVVPKGALIDPTTKLPIGVEEIKPTLDWSDTTKAMEAGVPQYKNKFQQWRAERKTPLGDFYDKTLDPKLTKLKESPFGKTVSYATAGYGAYTAFKGAPSYAEEFYNPNIGLAGAVLDETQQTTFLDDLFTDGTRSYNTEAMFAEAQNEYYTAFGTAPTKNWWERTQGGMSFEEFVYDFTLLPDDYSDDYLTA